MKKKLIGGIMETEGHYLKNINLKQDNETPTLTYRVN